jgi:TetR/AcrR family transcriptional regulator, repressor of fatR-cypB operon
VRKKDESKVQQIFQSTLQLVKEKGLAGLTMGDISRAAGIATGTMYIYFRNKEELVNDLYLECKTSTTEYYFKNIDPDLPFREKFRRLFCNIVDFKLEFFEIAVFLEQCYHSPFVCKNELKKQKGAQLLYALLEQGREEGFLKPLDNEVLIPFIFGCTNEIVKNAHYNTIQLTPERIALAYQLCWDGISVK